MIDYGLAGVIFTSLQMGLLSGVRYWLYQRNLRVSFKIMYVILWALSMLSAAIWLIFCKNGTFPYSYYRAIVAAVFFILSCVIIKEPLAKHAFSYAFIMAYDITFEAISVFVQSKFPTTSPYVYIATSAVVLAVTFIPLVRMLKRMIDKLSRIENDKLWSSLCIICFSFLFMNLLFTFPPSKTPRLIPLLSRILLFVAMGAIYYATTRVMETMSTAAEMKANLSLTERRIQAQQSYYDRLTSQIEEIRRIRHDLRHHRAAIATLIKNGDLATLSQYLEDTDIPENLVPVTGNFAIDSLLYYYDDVAKAEEIPLETKCVFSHSILVSAPDLCVIFGNLLENAIEAQKYVPAEKRYIQVLAQSDEKGFTLAIDNAFDGTLLKDGDIVLSRKQNGRHGVGIQSVKTLCDKYDGTFIIQADDENYRAGIVIGSNGNQA